MEGKKLGLEEELRQKLREEIQESEKLLKRFEALNLSAQLISYNIQANLFNVKLSLKDEKDKKAVISVIENRFLKQISSPLEEYLGEIRRYVQEAAQAIECDNVKVVQESMKKLQEILIHKVHLLKKNVPMYAFLFEIHNAYINEVLQDQVVLMKEIVAKIEAVYEDFLINVSRVEEYLKNWPSEDV